MFWLSSIKFWILVILLIPSTICSILILVYFYQQRHHILLYHHLTLVLIIISFLQMTTNIPFVMSYYQSSTVILASNAFCTWWNWWEYSLNGMLLFIMAWGSIERHLLIFHRTTLDTRRKRILFHLGPMLITGLYPLIFYFIVMILNSCKNQWNYDALFCELPCYLIDQPALATYDFIGDVVLPICTIAIANLYLILRVLRQKRRHHEGWRRQRKLTRQLVCLAVLYMLLWFPLTFNGLIITFIPSTNLLFIQVNYFFFLLHILPILLPFMSLACLSDFRRIVFRRQQGTVVPKAH